MSASNYNWLCFDCRIVIRQPKAAKLSPKCTCCHSECYCLGYKVEVPKKDNIRGWRKLRDDCRNREMEKIDVALVAKVRKQHANERRIAQLSALAENKERSRLIQKLKENLAT